MEPHFKLMRTGRPLVIAKFAMSIDGKIASVSGESKWITGVKAREYVHQLRSHSDAVMVGINTVLMDDPKLTARDGSLPEGFTQPLRVVVDSNRRTPATSAICNNDAKTLIATSKSNPHPDFPSSVSVKNFPSNSSGVDLDVLLKYLGDSSVTSVLVEGGSSLIGSLFDQRLVDKVFAFVAPIIIGGSSKGAVGGSGAYHMSDVERLVGVELKNIDEDILLTGYCSSKE
jgi:diaminohydroxyphosphoribosylaminopyrimidine deaminase/5-amino-6-(5-phosphoribosylamino)uracil reductase